MSDDSLLQSVVPDDSPEELDPIRAQQRPDSASTRDSSRGYPLAHMLAREPADEAPLDRSESIDQDSQIVDGRQTNNPIPRTKPGLLLRGIAQEAEKP